MLYLCAGIRFFLGDFRYQAEGDLGCKINVHLLADEGVVGIFGDFVPPFPDAFEDMRVPRYFLSLSNVLRAVEIEIPLHPPRHLIVLSVVQSIFRHLDDDAVLVDRLADFALYLLVSFPLGGCLRPRYPADDLPGRLCCYCFFVRVGMEEDEIRSLNFKRERERGGGEERKKQPEG